MTTSIPEALLHFVWLYKYFDSHKLLTTNNQSINIHNIGQYHHDAGPDFLHATLNIDGTYWVGHVEMHIKSGDWYKHNHQHDKQYENVILHVVYEANQKVYYPNGKEIPCLVLKNRIPQRIINNYLQLKTQQLWIPCAQNIHAIPASKIQFWKHRMAIERLESKVFKMQKELEQNHHHWEQLFYEYILKYSSAKVNRDAFAHLANIAPFTLIQKNANDVSKIESLLLGQAHFLCENNIGHQNKKWISDYKHQKAKYNLRPMSPTYWKFSRLRPSNFPTIRIALLARLFHKQKHLFSASMSATNLKELQGLFAISIKEGFWKNHYVLKKTSKPVDKSFGRDAVYNLLINVVIPFKFIYANYVGKPSLKEEALELLESLNPEKNKITRSWEKLGLSSNSAYDTQALIYLKQQYCEQYRCLECKIGHYIISR